MLASYLESTRHLFFDRHPRSDATPDLIRRADEARDCKDWPQAAKAYAAAISFGAANAGLRVQLGHALKEMGDFNGAERAYRDFQRDNPHDADIHLQLGHLFNKKGDPFQALAFYQLARQLAPDDAEIALHLHTTCTIIGRIELVRRRDAAMALVAARKWTEAEPLLQALVEIHGEKDLIGIFANVTKEAGRLDEAAKLYKRYLAYAEGSGKPSLVADCFMQLGHLHKIRIDYPAAFKCFLNARNIEREDSQHDPDESEAEREILACLREIYPCFVFQG